MTAGQPLAALDVGSNTVRLLVARLAGGRLEQIEDSSEFVRLGKGVDSNGNLDPDRMAAAIKAIEDLADRARTHNIRRLVAVATSAVRDAANGRQFAQDVHHKIGLDLAILEGDDEARLTALGVLTDLEHHRSSVVCDLGGGSAEIIAVSHDSVMWGKSLQLGSGRLTERFIHHDPPTQPEVDMLVRHVHDALDALPDAIPEIAILTGGTATHAATLADLHGDVVRFSAQDLDRVRDVVNAIPSRSVVAKYGVTPERAQVLAAGLNTLAAIVGHYGVTQVVVTRHGIREGVLVDVLQREGLWPNSRR
ncbi:MAG: hypothetical protein NVS2B16_16140 [Chloroflexota bacterium]